MTHHFVKQIHLVRKPIIIHYSAHLTVPIHQQLGICTLMHIQPLDINAFLRVCTTSIQLYCNGFAQTIVTAYQLLAINIISRR